MGSIPNADISLYEFRENAAPQTQRTSRLHYAAHDGDCERIKEYLAEGFDIEEKDGFGRTPLLRAAVRGHIDAFDLLLRHGADFKAKDNYERGAEHLAAENGHLNVLFRIMERGGEGVLDSRDNYGRTPVHLASLKGQNDVLLSLSTFSNFDVNVKDDWGRTPLHLAYKEGHKETALILINKGADTESEDIFGKRPEDMQKKEKSALLFQRQGGLIIQEP